MTEDSKRTRREQPGGYLVKHFVRSFLVAVATEEDWAASPGMLGSTTVGSAHAQWLPDQTGTMEPLHTWTLAEVRRQFGISPLLVSMLGCFAQALSQDQTETLLRVSSESLLPAVTDWEEWRTALPARGGLLATHPG